MIKDFRKLFADTAVTTTHFLKKCVKVPKITTATKDDPTGLPVMEAQRILEQQQKDYFRRGVMHFEDYNYAMYNRHLLINPDIDEYDDSASSGEDSQGEKKEKPLGFMQEQEVDEEKIAPHLTDKVIEQSVHESYKHSQLDVQTDEELVQAQQKALEDRIKEKNKAADEAEEARQAEEEEKKAQAEEDQEEKDEDEVEEENPDGDNKSEEIEYEIFYD
jgi:hypothetical protein